jgi:hypothetical protein
MMATHPSKFVPMTLTKYPISVRNGEIPTIFIENGFFYNRVRTKSIEVLEGNHSNGFKKIHVSYGARKIVVVDLDVVILINELIINNTFPQCSYY